MRDKLAHTCKTELTIAIFVYFDDYYVHDNDDDNNNSNNNTFLNRFSKYDGTCTLCVWRCEGLCTGQTGTLSRFCISEGCVEFWLHSVTNCER